MTAGKVLLHSSHSSFHESNGLGWPEQLCVNFLLTNPGWELNPVPPIRCFNQWTNVHEITRKKDGTVSNNEPFDSERQL
jgi:hypothetical protein